MNKLEREMEVVWGDGVERAGLVVLVSLTPLSLPFHLFTSLVVISLS